MIGRILITCGALALASGAVAQTATNAGAHNPAVKNSSAAHVAAPAVGANSFTAAQARGRFAKAGYKVAGLAKDKDGVWRGKATHAGKSMNVALDYKGNVTTK
ncbi:hypothetical protein [Sphingomonas sp.]|uniref:hypothetical protein n=1 Tax=Sphingomonas sp. TaxID=28214 RepID=UPI0025E67B55|nr:hypothetical protein [Sphingomonas sp.]